MATKTLFSYFLPILSAEKATQVKGDGPESAFLAARPTPHVVSRIWECLVSSSRARAHAFLHAQRPRGHGAGGRGKHIFLRMMPKILAQTEQDGRTLFFFLIHFCRSSLKKDLFELENVL